jgi:hypothetical protein
MFAGPLRNVNLRRHRASLQRPLPRELDALFLAHVRLRQPAHHHDDLDHCVPSRGRLIVPHQSGG